MIKEIEYIKGIQQGDRNVMQEVYELYFPKISNLCYRYSNDKDETIDFVHDGFIKVFTEFNKFKQGVPLEAWIMTVIRNNTIEQLKKKNRIPETEFIDGIMDVEDEDISEEEQNNWRYNITSDEVLSYINLLSLKDQLIIKMHTMDKMTHSEIAQQMGISEGTSKSQLSRARVKLINLIRNNISK